MIEDTHTVPIHHSEILLPLQISTSIILKMLEELLFTSPPLPSQCKPPRSGLCIILTMIHIFDTMSAKWQIDKILH